MGSIGATELIIVLLVVLLLFGATRLPKLARSMGEASKEFKRGIKDKDDDAAATPPPPELKVTMTQAELDAMLAAEREAQARKDLPPPAS
ncbi:MAG TPA: twin-arginine translocase TatA/TatE family subunit [Acidimicrobiales bacterium]|nr:twin-arginine translocase TatA/TatE family subunit [Acidimicrobiales bacterium]